MMKASIMDMPMGRLYFTLLTGVIAAPFLYLGLSAKDSWLRDRLREQKGRMFLKRIIPLPKVAVILNTAGVYIIFNLVGAVLLRITGNRIFTLLAKSGASLGMGVTFLAIALVCGEGRRHS